MQRHILFLFSLLLFISCTGNKQENIAGNNEAIPDTVAPPRVTMLADLPDSLQPKTRSLDTMPIPRTIVVPGRPGGYYSSTDAKGEVQKIKLEPPVNKSLPVLLNEKGESIKDSAGNSFIMGDGGLSDFTNFTTDNGLAMDAISCSVMDQTGQLWFGTFGGGVSRYNGRTFTSFTTAQGLANNYVLCMAVDKTGNLWFSTWGGVSRYDGKTFRTFFSNSRRQASTTVWTIVSDNVGNLWFGTNGGVKRYDGKSFITFTTAQGLANNDVRCIAVDKTGNLWFGTGGGGISRYDPSVSLLPGSKAFTTFSTAQGLAGNDVRCVAEDKLGNLWFGSYGAGVSRLDLSVLPVSSADGLNAGSKIFTSFSTAQGLPGNDVRSIAEDKMGNLWFGTYGGGVSRFDGKKISTFSIAQGLAGNRVQSIVVDKTGNLWFGTDGGGCSRYDGQAFVTFSTAHGLANNDIKSIAEDKMGNLWFGAIAGGVSRYDGKSFINFTTAQGLTRNDVLSITADKTGNLWFGTLDGGVSRYDGRSFVTFTTAQGLANDRVFSITGDNSGNLWFGTYGGGVCRYDGRSFTTFSVAQGLAGTAVWSTYADRAGNLWFGTWGNGVSCFDGKSFINFSTAQGLADNQVFSITQDKRGNIWFGTKNGLSVLSAEELRKLITITKSAQAGHRNLFQGKDLPVFRTFRESDGLPDARVTQVEQLPDGRMAVGTNLGITLFKPSEDLSRLENIEIFNSQTDCPVKNVTHGHNTIFTDRSGIVWISTGSEKTALVRFDPSALPVRKDSPTLFIKSVKVNEENICWNDLSRKSKTVSRRPDAIDSMTTPANITEEVTTIGRVLTEKERDSVWNSFGAIEFDGIARFYPIPEHLVLPYWYNDITIDFSAVETDKPQLVNYRYMLEGYDRDWSPVLKKTSATFGNIREGSYTFKVKAQGPNGVWCVPVTYSFKVSPPWYRTWWAYLIYITASVVVLYLIYRWRTAALRREKEKLEKTVIARTAEVVAEKKEVEKQKAVVEKEKQRSDELLLNILPEEVAEELKAKGSAEAKLIDEVTVLFTDFKGFTQLSEKLSAKALVAEINNCFSAFDLIMQKYGVEKIKTIGDSYMAAGGLPTPNKTHPDDVVNAALEIQKYMQEHKKMKEAAGELFFEIRIGIHTGPVVAGIVGIKKFQYDIWGDTVNTASRMESSGGVGRVNISQTTYDLVKDKFNCEYRGEIDAKGKGQMKMYYVENATLHDTF